MNPGLPIEAALAALRAALHSPGVAVLQAPPGAGKSTGVPLALLAEDWMRGKRLLLLEPRRLAARAVAMRMASLLGEPVGATVGYRMRLDTRVSAATRIEVLTEGVLTRMLQSDPALEGVGAVLFDEFHERSLQADLGLALTLDARTHLNPELRLLIMSATLEPVPLAQLLGGAAVLNVPGRLFPVTTHYTGRGPPLLPESAARGESPERRVPTLIRAALQAGEGDVLVFLPGAREIRRVQSLLEADPPVAAPEVLALFADLGAAQQEAALNPAPSRRRKVVLATNIAETSLTIPGVRAVVDSGLVRRARFDPVTGMTRLETQRISRASADQRQGRAGRLGPGVCYRAWSEGAHETLAAFTPPEILEADLAPLALELAAWGAREVSALQWLDAPPAAMLASARDLLRRLGALTSEGTITAHGREMAQLGVHPRLAHMLLRARELDLLPLGTALASLLTERDLLRGAAGRDADVRSRLEVLHGEATPAGVDRASLERARRGARDLLRQLGGRQASYTHEASGVLLACAYPDRIGRRRAGSEGRYALSNGRGALFREPQSLAREEFIVAVDLDDAERDARILLAAALRREDLYRHFADSLVREESVQWQSREQAVLAQRTVRLGALRLEEQPLAPPAGAAIAAMLEGVRELGLSVLPWEHEARELRARIEFVRESAPQAQPPWPAVSDAALLADLEHWLAPYLAGITRREQLTKVPLLAALQGLLSGAQRHALESLAPEQLLVPSGSRIRIDYSSPQAPAVAVRLQEVFGLASTPLLGPARIPLTFRLLSPAQRPVQVTRDLASFWRGTYAEVRGDLRGRYPRHYWPEDPLQAQPVRGVKRRS